MFSRCSSGQTERPDGAPNRSQVQVRRFIPRIERDLNSVLEIGRAAFPEEGWNKSLVNDLNSARFGHAFVAEERYIIKGFMFCVIKDGVVDLLKLAVDSQFRKQGIGTRMINDLVVGLRQLRISKIIARVAEGDLGAQIFLSKRGFEANNILKEGRTWKGRDLYQFELAVSYFENG
jgi:ribosomal protein S18 acetylase RimI-like enzyme